ncbi:MAG: pyridoxamine 5'-phosphate oxidase family protein [Prolixibacteraceae bacterium]|nr:pyridoxamine 5'-phosphate oxidase family protein [Prolixibacteraceae bacterium]
MRTLEIKNHEEIGEIIRSCRTCYLGLCDLSNQPYVIPMNFGYDGKALYLHSGQSGRKWDIMKSNPKACITFCLGEELAWQNETVACSYRIKSKTVIAEGTIEFIDNDEEKIIALDIITAQYSKLKFKYSAPAIKNVGVYKLNIEKIEAREFGAKAVTPWNS